MKIGIKILLSFIVIIVSIGVMGYLTITTSQEKIISEIGNDHSDTLSQTMRSIDNGIREKVLGLVTLSDKVFVEDFLANYPLDDASQLTEFSSDEILRNDLSLKLQESVQFIENKYGYELYNDVFIINSHGFIVASDNPIDTIPVERGDWWDTVLDEGIFISDVQFDDDTKIYTQEFAYKIQSFDGTFLGVLKTDIKLQDIIVSIYDIRSQNKFLDSNLFLVDSTGRILYDSSTPEFGNHIPLTEYVMMSEPSDYFLHTDDQGTGFINVYSKSQPQADFPNLGWTLVVKQSTDKILKPVVALTNIILIVSMTTITSAAVIAIYVRSSISQPLMKLRDASVKIAEGDYDVKIDGQNIVPKFTTIISDVEALSVIDDVESLPLYLKHVESLSNGGTLLEVGGTVDVDYNRVDLYLELPDGTVETHRAFLNTHNEYWLPLTKPIWMPGEYEVTLAALDSKISSRGFTVFEPTTEKTPLEIAFENERASRPTSTLTTNIESEIILPNFDVDVRSKDVKTSSSIGDLTVTMPDVNMYQDAMLFSGHVNFDDSRGGFVELSMTRPNGEIDLIKTLVTKDGLFETQLLESWQTGEYLIDAKYGSSEIGSIVFYLGETTDDIPDDSCGADNCVSIQPTSDVVESEVFATVDWYNPIIVDVSGTVAEFDKGGVVEVMIVKPDNSVAELEIKPSSTGEFNVPALYNERWLDGVYTIIITYQDEEISRATFSR